MFGKFRSCLDYFLSGAIGSVTCPQDLPFKLWQFCRVNIFINLQQFYWVYFANFVILNLRYKKHIQMETQKSRESKIYSIHMIRTTLVRIKDL